MVANAMAATNIDFMLDNWRIDLVKSIKRYKLKGLDEYQMRETGRRSKVFKESMQIKTSGAQMTERAFLEMIDGQMQYINIPPEERAVRLLPRLAVPPANAWNALSCEIMHVGIDTALSSFQTAAA